MPKAGELDWSGFMKGDRGEAEHPLSKPIKVGPRLAKGEVPVAPPDWAVRKAILDGAPAQPTDEQLFGGGVVTEEQAQAAQEQWNSQFTRFFKTKHTPVEKQSSVKDWGSRGPVDFKDRSQLTEEEQRISAIPVNPSLLSED